MAAMTKDELAAAIDDMIQAANGDADKLPGLITINADEWCAGLCEIEHATRNLEEGTRHRGIRVWISSEYQTKVLTRAEAGDIGKPFRDVV